MDRLEKKAYIPKDSNSFEDGQRNCNVEEIMEQSSTTSSILRNRANQNTAVEKDLQSDAKIISEMISSVKDKEAQNSPKTYLKIYPKNEQSTKIEHSTILEQSKQPLLYEKERLVAIVKPTNSENVSSNVYTTQKYDLGSACDGRQSTHPDLKVMASSDDVIFSGDQNPANDVDTNDKDSKQEPKILSVDFDEILPHVGEMGRYQLALYLLMCIPATLPAAFLAFNQVFLSATPTHWCREPHLYKYNEVCFDALSMLFLYIRYILITILTIN